MSAAGHPHNDLLAAPRVVVHPTEELLAAAVAARLLTRLLDVRSAGRSPAVVLTGGSVAARVYAAVGDCAARDAVDWRAVHLWWGDERFLPAGHAERNETQARAALLDRLPLDAGHVHPMPASDGPLGDDPDAAAAAYARDWAAAGELDVLLLGVGPDGHVASLFPGTPAVESDGPVVAVRGAPKPPPTRLSLSMSALGRADAVWFVVSGAEKADVVRRALSGAPVTDVPAAGPGGRSETLWLLDEAAAAELPRLPAG